jgi:hypothetical protein
MAELVPELTTLPGLVSRRRARRVGRRRLPSFRGCQTACSTAAAASPFPRVAGDRRRARARPARPRRGRVRRRGGCSTSSATAASRTPWRKGGEPPPVRRARLGAGEEPALLAPRRRARAGAAAVAADHDLDRYRRVAFVRYLHESCRGRRDGANGSLAALPLRRRRRRVDDGRGAQADAPLCSRSPRRRSLSSPIVTIPRSSRCSRACRRPC